VVLPLNAPRGYKPNSDFQDTLVTDIILRNQVVRINKVWL